MLGGNLLSIYETSDELGPCQKLAARSHLKSFKEVAISTGKKHGALFSAAAAVDTTIESLDNRDQSLRGIEEKGDGRTNYE